MTDTVLQRLALSLDTASHAADRVARLWLTATIACMALLVAAQVFGRYVLNDSIFWSEEVGRILLVQMTFLGGAVALRAGAQPGMDALTRHLTRRGRRVAQWLVLCTSLLFFGLTAWHGARFAWFVRHQSTPALGISRTVPVVVVPVGAAFATLHVLAAMACLAVANRPPRGGAGCDAPSSQDPQGMAETPGTTAAPGRHHPDEAADSPAPQHHPMPDPPGHRGDRP